MGEPIKDFIAKQFLHQRFHFRCPCIVPLDFEGEIVSYDGENTAERVKEGTHLYIKATVPEGELFSCWIDENRNIQSYEEEYDFYVTSNVKILAMFTSEVVRKEPVVHFTGSKYELYLLQIYSYDFAILCCTKNIQYLFMFFDYLLLFFYFIKN